MPRTDAILNPLPIGPKEITLHPQFAPFAPPGESAGSWTTRTTEPLLSPDIAVWRLCHDKLWLVAAFPLAQPRRVCHTAD